MVPLAVFVTAAVAGVLALPLGLVGWAAAAILPAAYLLGVRAGRVFLLAAVLVTAGLFAAAATVVAHGWWTGAGPMALAAMLVGASLGAAARSRREAVEQESRRRLVEERLRIARDVHDLVAHNLAVVTVQAGAAVNLLPDRPEAAREALDHVRAAGADVLDELGTLLGVLRGDDAVPTTEPTPGLPDLGRLLDSFATAGLRVDHTVSGSAVTVAATVQATAYRVVQESLTNAARHGDGRARLRLTHTPGGLHIEVRNRCVPGRTAGTGHGLSGMRERVAAAGGTLAAGPTPSGEFVVDVRLPAREGR